MEGLGRYFSRELASQAFMVVDRDGSGSLDLAEFLELMGKVGWG